MTPQIRFNAETCELLAKHFGYNRPFFVVRKDLIVDAEGESKGERVYFADGVTTVTVPNVIGLDLGSALYIAEHDGDVYEWQNHFTVQQFTCSNNQTKALAFGSHPIITNKA